MYYFGFRSILIFGFGSSKGPSIKYVRFFSGFLTPIPLYAKFMISSIYLNIRTFWMALKITIFVVNIKVQFLTRISTKHSSKLKPSLLQHREQKFKQLNLWTFRGRPISIYFLRCTYIRMNRFFSWLQTRFKSLLSLPSWWRFNNFSNNASGTRS